MFWREHCTKTTAAPAGLRKTKRFDVRAAQMRKANDE
jgi:hypothetical protein